MKFLNGKDFHPSNFKNQERLWRAEERKKEEDKRMKELAIERQKEWQKEQLQKLALEQKMTASTSGVASSKEIKSMGNTFQIGAAPITQNKHELKRKREELNQTFPKVNLHEYSAAKDLEPLGLDHLKTELMRLGLKCGGTIEERAERLFGTKGMSLASLPKEYFPNNKKPKALSTN